MTPLGWAGLGWAARTEGGRYGGRRCGCLGGRPRAGRRPGRPHSRRTRCSARSSAQLRAGRSVPGERERSCWHRPRCFPAPPGSGGLGRAEVRSPCVAQTSDELMPASSEMDLSLSEAEHHQQWRQHLWITDLRNEEKDPEQQKLQPRRGVSGTALQTPSSVRKEGSRCYRLWSRGSPAAPGADHGEAAVPLQPKEVPGETDPPAAPGGTHTRAGGCLQEPVAPLGACAGADAWQDWEAREEPHCNRFAAGFVTLQGTYTLTGGA
ncbi:uncharacterized protein LOC132325715 [Haemorhous mexicanus]|uniref:uncharacterized protein LOC132325715 n=1 Tax=Haemorhous mexicanus TaxID=30427 RepID=UPI0028BD978A|nr:uncharacterized protein LOC132325715 [Haemorhous mexicanus]